MQLGMMGKPLHGRADQREAEGDRGTLQPGENDRRSSQASGCIRIDILPLVKNIRRNEHVKSGQSIILPVCLVSFSVCRVQPPKFPFALYSVKIIPIPLKRVFPAILLKRNDL